MKARAHVLAWMALGAWACTRSPDPRLYTIATAPGRQVVQAPQVVEVRRPAVAGYLDRPQIVLALASQRLELSDTDQWAEPLSDMLGRVLADDLAQRLPRSKVFTEASTLSADADVRVEVDVQRFERRDGEQVALVAVVALRHGDAQSEVVLHRFALSEPLDGRGTEALVSALSRLVAALADAIATALGPLAPPDV